MWYPFAHALWTTLKEMHCIGYKRPVTALPVQIKLKRQNYIKSLAWCFFSYDITFTVVFQGWFPTHISPTSSFPKPIALLVLFEWASAAAPKNIVHPKTTIWKQCFCSHSGFCILRWTNEHSWLILIKISLLTWVTTVHSAAITNNFCWSRGIPWMKPNLSFESQVSCKCIFIERTTRIMKYKGMKNKGQYSKRGKK